jgi:hypothetical protein
VEVDDEEYEEDGYDLQEVEIDDEDWEVADAGENDTSCVFPMCKFSSQFHASPDFTKQYNRMRQHQQALTAASSTSMKATSSAVPLPARNISRSRAAVPSAATSTASRTKLAPLATATATLPGVSSAPKAAYTKANQKDKADRATQEQVLDPRTKNVLASLVRKGLVESVGGCVSTGKEVGLSCFFHINPIRSLTAFPHRPTSTMEHHRPHHLSLPTLPLPIRLPTPTR